jgi:hypothetical protein
VVGGASVSHAAAYHGLGGPRSTFALRDTAGSFAVAGYQAGRRNVRQRHDAYARATSTGASEIEELNDATVAGRRGKMTVMSGVKPHDP